MVTDSIQKCEGGDGVPIGITYGLTHPEELLVCDVLGVRDGVTCCVRSSSSDEESIVKSITSCCGLAFFSGDPFKIEYKCVLKAITSENWI